MAGRPRTMAKRLAELEEAAFQLNLNLCALRPAQYAARQGDEGDDELAVWWNEAVHVVGMGSIAVALLLSHLEERAGLDWENLERQREQRRGLVPSETAEGDGTENTTGVET